MAAAVISILIEMYSCVKAGPAQQASSDGEKLVIVMPIYKYSHVYQQWWIVLRMRPFQMYVAMKLLHITNLSYHVIVKDKQRNVLYMYKWTKDN